MESGVVSAGPSDAVGVEGASEECEECVGCFSSATDLVGLLLGALRNGDIGPLQVPTGDGLRGCDVVRMIWGSRGVVGWSMGLAPRRGVGR